MKKIYPFVMLAVGAFFGVAARLLDIYTQNLGNIFSEMSIWILICVWITLKANSMCACFYVLYRHVGGLLYYSGVNPWILLYAVYNWLVSVYPFNPVNGMCNILC